ncbi:MAG: hypothetical protein DYH13_05510 [Alphaproteobacteria bacterium PRO2]|nr:hypothetical protein [Alphaproteobacteria bacterium PRO2]
MFMKAVKLATIGVAAAVAWQLFLDPLFFNIIHDPTNIIAQAWTEKINNLFGWIPQHAGVAHKPGLLTPVMKWVLKDEIAKVTASATTETATGIAATAGIGENLSGLSPSNFAFEPT